MQESGECLTVSDVPVPTREFQEAVIGAAHDNGLQAFAHATSLRDTLLVLDAGIDAMAHQFFDKPHTQELIDAYRKSNAFLMPTLTAISSMMGLSTAKEWADGYSENILAAVRERLCHHMKISQPGCSAQFAYDSIKALKAAGIDIVWYVNIIPSASDITLIRVPIVGLTQAQQYTALHWDPPYTSSCTYM
jgi:hypothetical protein